MPPTPGRPHEPTIHPRTKSEANEYALKNRTTNDWMRHDGKNIELLPQPAPRTGVSKQAIAIALKARGDASNWFQHDPNAPPEAKPVARCPTPEARVAFEKVYGNNEAWFKHDDNMNYYDKVPTRLGAVGGAEVKKKFVSMEASEKIKDWYLHDHGSNDQYKPTAVKHNTGPAVEPVLNNQKKIRGEAGEPKWFQHKATPSSDNTRPVPKVKTNEAMENMARDRGGADYYRKEYSEPLAETYHPKVGSREGGEIATRLAGESSDWFTHKQGHTIDEGIGFHKGASASVQEMRDRNNKCMMRQVLGIDRVGKVTPAGHRAVKPEAEAIARLHTTGNISGVFNEAANRNYNDESHGAPRAIRPEAAANFERNKGGIGDCFQGYLDRPTVKKQHRLPPNDEIAAKHSGSSMDSVMKGLGQPGSGRFHMGRGLRPEAESNAMKHTGSSMFDVFQAGHEEYVKTAPKVRSELAMDIAQRNHGSVANLII